MGTCMDVEYSSAEPHCSAQSTAKPCAMLREQQQHCQCRQRSLHAAASKPAPLHGALDSEAVLEPAALPLCHAQCALPLALSTAAFVAQLPQHQTLTPTARLHYCSQLLKLDCSLADLHHPTFFAQPASWHPWLLLPLLLPHAPPPAPGGSAAPPSTSAPLRHPAAVPRHVECKGLIGHWLIAVIVQRSQPGVCQPKRRSLAKLHSRPHLDLLLHRSTACPAAGPSHMLPLSRGRRCLQFEKHSTPATTACSFTSSRLACPTVIAAASTAPPS